MGAFVLDRFYYADLWAPLRFAIPATHTIEEESSLEHLEGDAELIGEGRMGSVYRQQIQGRDVAVKLLVYSSKRRVDDEYAYPTHLRREMHHEMQVYKHLDMLQGKTIPVLLWYGELVDGMADALATEYSGAPLPDSPSHAHFHSAIYALDSIHQQGVLHGDLALRNFVCRGDQVYIIDFGFSRFRTDMTEVEWMERVLQERLTLEKECGMTSSKKRAFGEMEMFPE